MSEAQRGGFHKPLAKVGEIRLLYLETLEECGPDDYKLWCSIKHIKLSDKTPEDPDLNERVRYEALSYEWGPEENLQHLWIRGHPTPLLIRENLYIALVALLLPDAWRPLWVDAICIDQENVRERNSQVTQMATIFSSADLVIVWLGRAESDSSRAMKLLAQIEVAPDMQGVHEPHEVFDLKDFTHIFTKENYKGIIALEALCLRTYWNRLWIVQEVSKAKAVVLRCGLDVVSVKNLRLMCDIIEVALDSSLAVIRTRPPRVDSALRNIKGSRAAQLVSIRKHLKPSIFYTEISAGTQFRNRHDILTFFERNADAECRHPQDMIFGLLSMCPSCCQALVPVDYSMPGSELCYKVLEHHIAKHSGLEDFQLLLKRSKLLHQRLKALPRIFSSLPPASTALVSGLSLQCTPRRYIRYVSNYPNLSSHALGFYFRHNCRSILKINTQRDLVCSIPPQYSCNEGDWEIEWLKYNFSSRQRENGNILQVPQIKDALNKLLQQVLQVENWSKLSNYCRAVDDEGQIYESLALLLELARGEIKEGQWVSPLPYKVGVDDEGVAYFVPSGTQSGDILCQIETGGRANAMGLLQDSASGDTFIAGRAIPYFTGMTSEKEERSEDTALTEKLPIEDQPSLNSAWREEIFATFTVDIYAAQLLTRPSFFGQEVPQQNASDDGKILSW